MKVLIAEDDSTSAIVLRKALEKLGHEAVVATDGEQAYALLQQDTEFIYRVVISDWMMPGMDGLELTRKLRSERKPTDPYRFIVLLTARGRPEDRRQGLDAGADDFMVKPLDMGDLIPRLSVAERMLSLEDAVVAASKTPAPLDDYSRMSYPLPADGFEIGFKREQVPPYFQGYPMPEEYSDEDIDENAAPTVSPEDQAACATLFSALIDSYQAIKVHFEPTMGDNYRLRIRTAQDKSILVGNQPTTFTGTIAYLEAFLRRRQQGVAQLPLSSEREVQLNIEKLEYSDKRRRYYVQIRRDNKNNPLAPLSLDALPMSAPVRQKLTEVLRDGYTHRGILIVTAPVTSDHMLAQTARGVRTFFTDDQTTLVDEYECGPDYTTRKRIDLLDQSPDVCVIRSESFLAETTTFDATPFPLLQPAFTMPNVAPPGYLSASTLSSVSARTFLVVLVPYGTVANCYRRLSTPEMARVLRAGGLLGILGVTPVLPDGSNAADRYELKTAVELFGE